MLRGLFLLLLLLSLLKNNNNQNKQNYLNVVTTQIQNFTYNHIYHHDDAADDDYHDILLPKMLLTNFANMYVVLIEPNKGYCFFSNCSLCLLEKRWDRRKLVHSIKKWFYIQQSHEGKTGVIFPLIKK